MKKGTENMKKNTFYKTNSSGGISLIVLVITIIVVIILAAAVIISLQNNNPMVEANKARINSDVANMQAIFTNTVGKIMAENQDVVQVVGGLLYTTPTGQKKTVGEATYQILGTDGTPVLEGKIRFSTEKSEGTTYCTGRELPLYSSDTKWSVDNQGLLSVVVGGITYGEGEKSDDLPVEEGEEIVESDNPMLQSWTHNSTTDFHNAEYREKITKIKFATNIKVPKNVVSWDVSEAKDKSVMAWVQDDKNEGYILTIAGKSKILANINSNYLLYNFTNLKEIENLEILDTSNVTNMSNMFRNCSSLTSINLSNFNTSNVTSMISLFVDCSSITSLDLSNFQTSKVTRMDNMFTACSNLENLKFSNNFDTSNVTNMSNMFERCSSITSLDLSIFNTSNLLNSATMFNNCSSLINLDLSSFDFSKVISVAFMFENCTKLTTTININSENIEELVNNKYIRIFNGAATNSDAKIIVNYTAETSSLVDSLIATKSENSNVVKGVQI